MRCSPPLSRRPDLARFDCEGSFVALLFPDRSYFALLGRITSFYIRDALRTRPRCAGCVASVLGIRGADLEGI